MIFNIILATGAEQSMKNPDCGADKEGAKNY